MVAGKVNETLSKVMAFKGSDGLSDAERHAYEKCKHLSCLHEACYKRFMYSSPKKQKKECSGLMADWRECFTSERERHEKSR